MEYSARQPENIVDFNIQTLVNFKDNIKYKGDLPLLLILRLLQQTILI